MLAVEAFGSVSREGESLGGIREREARGVIYLNINDGYIVAGGLVRGRGCECDIITVAMYDCHICI